MHLITTTLPSTFILMGGGRVPGLISTEGTGTRARPWQSARGRLRAGSQVSFSLQSQGQSCCLTAGSTASDMLVGLTSVLQET